MNKALSILLLIFFMNVFKIDAQIKEPHPSKYDQHKMANFLLEKSKREKTTSWILLGGGTGIFIIGRIIGTSSYNSSPRGINSTSTGIGAAMMLAGVVAMITSVPFFLSSGTNKKEANLIFRNESQSFLRQFHNKANVFSVGVNLRLY